MSTEETQIDTIELPVPGSYNCNPESLDEFYENQEALETETLDADGFAVDAPKPPISGPDSIPEKTKYWEILKSQLLNKDVRNAIGVGKALDSTSLNQTAQQQVEDQATLRDGLNLLGKLVAEQAALKEAIDKQRQQAQEASQTFADWQNYLRNPNGLQNLQNFQRKFSRSLDILERIGRDQASGLREAQILDSLKRNNIRITEVGAALEDLSDVIAGGTDFFGALLENTVKLGNRDAARQIREAREGIANFYSEVKKATKDILGPVANGIDSWTNFKTRMEQGITPNEILDGLANLEKQLGNFPLVPQISKAAQNLQKELGKLQQLDQEVAEALNTARLLIESVSIMILSICKLIPAVLELVEFFKRLIPFMGQLAILTLVQLLAPANINLRMPQINVASAASWRGLTTALAGLGKSLKACGEPLKELAAFAEGASSALNGLDTGTQELISNLGKWLAEQMVKIPGVSATPEGLNIQIDPNPLAQIRKSVVSMVDDNPPRPPMTPDIMGLLAQLFGAAASFQFNAAKFGFGGSDIDKLDLLKRFDNTANQRKAMAGAGPFKHLKNQKKVISEALKIAKTSAATTQVFITAAREIEKLGYDVSEEDAKNALEAIVESTQTLAVMDNAVLNENLEESSMSPIARGFYNCKSSKGNDIHSDELNHPTGGDKTNPTAITEALNQDLADIINTSVGLPNSVIQIAEEIRKTGRGTNTTPASPSPNWAALNTYNKDDVVKHSGIFYKMISNDSIVGNASNKNPELEPSKWERVEDPRALPPSAFIMGLPLLAVSSNYYEPNYSSYLNFFVENYEIPNENNALMLSYFPLFLILQNSSSKDTLLKFMQFSTVLDNYANKETQGIFSSDQGVKLSAEDYVEVAIRSTGNTAGAYLGRGLVALSQFKKQTVAQTSKATAQLLKDANINPLSLLVYFLLHRPEDIRELVKWMNSISGVNKEIVLPTIGIISSEALRKRLHAAARNSEIYLTFDIHSPASFVSYANLIIQLRRQADLVGGPLGYEYFITVAIHSLLNRVRYHLRQPGLPNEETRSKISHLVKAAKNLTENLTHKEEMMRLINSLEILG